jgi:hypothetical protein
LIQVLLTMSCDRRKLGSFIEVSNKAKFEMIKIKIKNRFIYWGWQQGHNQSYWWRGPYYKRQGPFIIASIGQINKDHCSSCAKFS